MTKVSHLHGGLRDSVETETPPVLSRVEVQFRATRGNHISRNHRLTEIEPMIAGMRSSVPLRGSVGSRFIYWPVKRKVTRRYRVTVLTSAL